MKNKKKFTIISLCIIAFCILIDQILKIWVKTHMALGQDIPLLGSWCHLYFVENEGIAFGISFGENIGKLFLSIFRIGVVGFLIYYLWKIIKSSKADTIVVSIMSLIIAGALGNIIDSLFYGIIFDESTPFKVATLFPPEGGYAPFFYGRVVDMFYFKLFMIPQWVPGWGGHYFFPAIFNIADICVTFGIIGVLIFNKRIFTDNKKPKETAIPSEPANS